MSGDAAAQPAVIDWTPTDERRELGESLRRLLDAAVQTGASPADLRAAARAIDGVTESLAASTVRFDMSVQEDSYRAQMSLVGGWSHPIAPQLDLAVDGDSGHGQVVVGPVFQGGPGLVHGGIAALLIDHAMGCVAARRNRPAMTVRLSLRYRRPTPLGVPLKVSVHLDRTEGRRLYLTATIASGDDVTVEAEGVFMILTSENLSAVFGRD
jgi:acyl-coenzyme A thioesterase PaaI-like protein